MHRTAVQSTNIVSVGFDRETGVLEVEYHHGGVYQYPDTTAAEYAALMAASSKGRHLHQHFVQTGRTYQKMEEET